MSGWSDKKVSLNVSVYYIHLFGIRVYDLSDGWRGQHSSVEAALWKLHDLILKHLLLGSNIIIMNERANSSAKYFYKTIFNLYLRLLINRFFMV